MVLWFPFPDSQTRVCLHLHQHEILEVTSLYQTHNNYASYQAKQLHAHNIASYVVKICYSYQLHSFKVCCKLHGPAGVLYISQQSMHSDILWYVLVLAIGYSYMNQFMAHVVIYTCIRIYAYDNYMYSIIIIASYYDIVSQKWLAFY